MKEPDDCTEAEGFLTSGAADPSGLPNLGGFDYGLIVDRDVGMGDDGLHRPVVSPSRVISL